MSHNTKYFIDTNVLLRFMIGDVEHQFTQARSFFSAVERGEKHGIVSLLVINELIWISERFYNLNRKKYLQQFLKVLSLKHISCLEMKKLDLESLLQDFMQTKLDFTDFYLLFVAKNGYKPPLKKDQNYSVVSFDREMMEVFR